MTSSATDERQQASARLRGAGLKVTESRLAVFDVFRPGEHLDADDVHTRVAAILPSTSRQAVYGVLGALAEAGLLRKIEPAGSPALYETRTGDNHHHLVCTSCNTVFDVGCVVGEAACLTPSETHGFRIDTAEVTFWGLCPECSARSELS
ncbi:transcriptional repressor [Agromyces badenianii]|uniref:Transcriptional repressor n=1 Tax=Agromyces badenianii TaxID=2080742 RepID=A0A2S0WYR5_9MICO|nr:Fur family transcriptional regulator [Agromyces badenianii]AWB96503.1 transcriptional repressor [Agromyces badenianii]PWC05380.1 transcriptional repressor [Agromyces badenianii]